MQAGWPRGLLTCGHGALKVYVVVVQTEARSQFFGQRGVGVPPRWVAQDLLQDREQSGVVNQVAVGLAPHPPPSVRVTVSVGGLPTLILRVLVVAHQMPPMSSSFAPERLLRACPVQVGVVLRIELVQLGTCEGVLDDEILMPVVQPYLSALASRDIPRGQIKAQLSQCRVWAYLGLLVYMYGIGTACCGAWDCLCMGLALLVSTHSVLGELRALGVVHLARRRPR